MYAIWKIKVHTHVTFSIRYVPDQNARPVYINYQLLMSTQHVIPPGMFNNNMSFKIVASQTSSDRIDPSRQLALSQSERPGRKAN